MKTNRKLTTYLSVIILTALASCKGTPGSTSVKDSSVTATITSTTTSQRTPASRVNFVLDSLGITDDGEKKICTVSDEAVTVYINELKASLADSSQLNLEKKKAIDKEFNDKFKAIQPEVDKIKKQLSPMEASKMMEFIAGYETQREGPVLAAYSEVMVKKYNAILLRKTDSALKKNKNQ